MPRPNLEQIRADLGGKSFLDRRIYLALSPLFLFNSVLISRNTPSLENWLWLGISNLVALTICWGWIELGARVIFPKRDTEPVAIYQVLLFGLSLGTLKGLATGVTAVAVGFETNLAESLGSRLLQTPLLGVMVVLGASALASAQNRYQEERDLLVAERVREQSETGQLAELNAEIRRELRLFVIKAKDQLSKDRQPANRVIMDIVEQSLRPLSHKLWESESKRYANYVPGELIRLALLDKRYFGWPTAAFYAVITFPPALLYKGIADATVRTLLGALIITVIFSIGRLFPTKNLFAATCVYLATLSLATVGIMFASTAVLGALPIADPISISFAIFIWFVEVTLALGMVRVMRENHREIRRDLDRLLGTKSIKNEIEKSRNLLLNREFANYLHGSVQNQLISSALKIERNGNNPEVTLRELAEVERILESADKFSSSTSGATLLHQLKELKSNWAGFVEISIETSSDFSDLESITVQKLVQVANEGISNAVRHGHAENIQVHLTKTGTVIELSITDDGLGPVSKKPGLGTKFYNFVAPGNWSLNPDPKGGSILVLTLDSPLSATQL